MSCSSGVPLTELRVEIKVEIVTLCMAFIAFMIVLWVQNTNIQIQKGGRLYDVPDKASLKGFQLRRGQLENDSALTYKRAQIREAGEYAPCVMFITAPENIDRYPHCMSACFLSGPLVELHSERYPELSNRH